MTKKAASRPVIHEGQVLKAIPTPQIKLATIEDCRREMARVYRDARTGSIDTADASRLVYMLVSISKMIEAGQTEQQLTALMTDDRPVFYLNFPTTKKEEKIIEHNVQDVDVYDTNE